MTLSVSPNADLKLLQQSADGFQTWEAGGDDPAFKISYPFIRHRFVVASVFAISAPLDPKIYLDRGRGFREADSNSFAVGSGFVFLLDIGKVGSSRAFRIDPVSSSATFEWDIRSFPRREDARRYSDKLLADRTNSKLFELDDVPRYSPPRIKLPSLGRRSDATAAYINAHHKLAECVPIPAMRPAGSHWLSIVVPVYNTPVTYLDNLLQSFRLQEMPGAELILSDDGSTSKETRSWLHARGINGNVRVIFNDDNRGIAAATNAGLRVANGDWVTFLDHDDMIAPHGLKVIATAIAAVEGAQFFFSDEVIIDDSLQPKGLMLKPAFDPVLLSGVNYINHFSVYRYSRLAEIGFLQLGYDGSQDYDLLLRYLDGLPEDAIQHIPYPAYWWRQTGRSYSAKYLEKATQNARKAIADSFLRRGREVRVVPAITKTLHKVMFDASEDNLPKISIIIPSKNSVKLISRVLEGIFHKTDYPHFEVIVVDNGTTEKEVLALYERYANTHKNFLYEINVEEFNFSRSINRGLRISNADHVLLLNNDTEISDPFWLREMVQCLNFDRAGIVGAKLLYANDTIQHAGVIVGFGGLAGHWYSEKSRDFGGPMNRLHVRNSMSCVTGAVMLISGDCLKAIGEWDELNFPIAYNDVDYCLRAKNAGYRIVWTPFSCLYHHESVTRGSDASGVRRQRFEKEKDRLRSIHATRNYQDPTINPGYSTDRSEPISEPPLRFLPVRR